MAEKEFWAARKKVGKRKGRRLGRMVGRQGRDE